MTNNVSLQVQTRATQRNIARLQTDMIDLGNEVSTGKKQNLVQELKGEIRNFVDLKSLHSSLINRTERLVTGDNRLAQMGTAVKEIENISTPFQELQAQFPLLNRENVDVYVEQADNALQGIQNALNIQWGGRYLFSGADVTQRPIEGIEQLTTTVQSMITNYAATLPTGKITSQAQLDTLFLEIDSVFDDTHPTTTMSGLIYQGSNIDMAGIEISEGEIMQYEFRANNPEFINTIKGFAMLSATETIRSVVVNTDNVSRNKIEDAYIEKGINHATGGITDLIKIQASLGLKQQRIEYRKEGIEQTIFDYEQRLGRYENADQYEASVAYSEIQRQLEVSFYVTSSISDLSLLNYIR